MDSSEVLQAIEQASRIGSEALNLSRKQLSFLPPETGKLTKPRELNLEYNRLTSLPPEIGKLTSLWKLDLT